MNNNTIPQTILYCERDLNQPVDELSVQCFSNLVSKYE